MLYGRVTEILDWLRGKGDINLQMRLLSMWGIAATQRECQLQPTFKENFLAMLLSHMHEQGHLVDNDVGKTHRMLHELMASTHRDLHAVRGHT
jgi:hypothetical protein